MKTLETSEEKLQKICDALRRQTLEPAQEQAKTIIDEAHKRAEQIVKDAQQQAEGFKKEARQNIEQEKNVFYSSLSQAGKQALESLRQAIEHQFLNRDLHDIITGQTTNPKIIAELIAAVVKVLEKEGLATDLTVHIPQAVPAKEVNHLLGERLLNKLKEKSVVLDDFGGGVKVLLRGKNITIDVSNSVLEELILQYIRKDFRKMLFTKT